jgi:diaminopimelate epimerase
MLDKPKVTIIVGARKLTAEIDKDATVTVNMGHADFNWQVIPLAYEANPIALGFEAPSPYHQGHAVSIGNPHLVFFIDKEISQEEVSKIGSQFEQHPLFPERTNVNFARIVDKENIILKVWERGVGLTLACGSGACATASVAHKLGRVHQKVNVHFTGGVLRISNEGAGILMNGEVQIVFIGELMNALPHFQSQ